MAVRKATAHRLRTERRGPRATVSVETVSVETVSVETVSVETVSVETVSVETARRARPRPLPTAGGLG